MLPLYVSDNSTGIMTSASIALQYLPYMFYNKHFCNLWAVVYIALIIVSCVSAPIQLCSPKFIDWLLLLIGSAMAMIHGAALPVAMLVFGDLTNAFVNQYASTQLANYVFYFEPEDFLDRDEFFIVDPLILASGVIDFRNITGGVVNCSEDYVLIAPSINFDEALKLGVTRLAKCLEDDEFIDEVDGYVQLFAIIAMVVFLTSFVQIVFFQFSAERQIFGLKKRFYRAVLRQNIGWFDANPTGELSTKLSE